MANYRIFRYMDIKMRQQLIDKPFIPNPSCSLYRSGYNIAATLIGRDEDDNQWAAIRHCDGGDPSRSGSGKKARVS
jgi:hypothetical protein